MGTDTKDSKVPQFDSYEAFWPYYVGEHLDPLCRKLHFVGTIFGLSFLATAIVTANPFFILGALVSGYAFAWVGHFFIEKNRPATFSYPGWSFRGDFRMFRLMLLGKMDAEVRRLHGDAAADGVKRPAQA